MREGAPQFAISEGSVSGLVVADGVMYMVGSIRLSGDVGGYCWESLGSPILGRHNGGRFR